MESVRNPSKKTLGVEQDIEAPVSAALASELKAFCTAHSLTPRESDILSSLVEGVVRIKDIATRMGLSPNTVNNHVNSIFVKTKARSKSQLLSSLLTYVSEELQAARALRRKPRVAIVDSDAREASELSRGLTPRGFDAAGFGTAFPMTAWPDGLAGFAPEFIVVDHVSMATSEVTKLLDQARMVWGAQVIFCGQNESGLARRTAMASGAIDWYAKPCDVNRLSQILMAHAIAADSDATARARAIVFEKRAAAFKTMRDLVSLTKENIGLGGIYLPTEVLRRVLDTQVEAGDWIELKLNINSREVPARGQVVWHAADGAGAGAGVRFSYLDLETQAYLANLAREQGIRSYIPAGV